MPICRPAWYIGNVPWLFATRAARSFSQALLVIVVPLYVSAAGYISLLKNNGYNFDFGPLKMLLYRLQLAM